MQVEKKLSYPRCESIIRKRKLFIVSLVFASLIISCTGQPIVDIEGIHSTKAISRFLIAELEVSEYSLIDSLPTVVTEISRIECAVEAGQEPHKSISFVRETPGYLWRFRAPIRPSDIPETSTESFRVPNLEVPKGTYKIPPLTLLPGQWYRLWGLEDIEGHFFLFIESDKSLRVEYFSGGPW